jgi:hypothetical protein
MQSIKTSFDHGTYRATAANHEAEATPPSSPGSEEYFDAKSSFSYDAPSSPAAERQAEEAEREGRADVLSGFADGSSENYPATLDRKDSILSLSSLNSESSIGSGVSSLVFERVPTPVPEAKTGDPSKDVPKLTVKELHEAIEKHYGMTKWESDFQPHLTDRQHEAVNEYIHNYIRNVDEELGIRRPERTDVDKITRLLTGNGAQPSEGIVRAEGSTQPSGRAARPSGGNKLTKKKPDYTEYHRLQATVMPDLSAKQRALTLLTAKKKAEGSVMPKVSAYADYYTNPKRIIQSVKDSAKSIIDKKRDAAEGS